MTRQSVHVVAPRHNQRSRREICGSKCSITDTTAEAIAPPLEEALKDRWHCNGRKEANERLDEILSAGNKPPIVKVDLSLRNRELTSEADVEALVTEVRDRLLEQIRAGVRVRLV